MKAVHGVILLGLAGCQHHGLEKGRGGSPSSQRRHCTIKPEITPSPKLGSAGLSPAESPPQGTKEEDG